jgi:hypothetical protein
VDLDEENIEHTPVLSEWRLTDADAAAQLLPNIPPNTDVTAFRWTVCALYMPSVDPRLPPKVEMVNIDEMDNADTDAALLYRMRK